MSGGAGEVAMAAVGLIANFSAGNIRDEHGDAVCVLVGLNGQSIGMNHQATADQFAIISESSHNTDVEENAERR
jgi:hypothetical protein